jgi:hypothetical protein
MECRLFLRGLPMKVSRRIAVITARELKLFIAHAAMRAGRKPESIRAAKHSSGRFRNS